MLRGISASSEEATATLLSKYISLADNPSELTAEQTNPQRKKASNKLEAFFFVLNMVPGAGTVMRG